MKKYGLLLGVVLIVGIYRLEAQDNDRKSLLIISPGIGIFNNGDQTGVSFSNDYIRNVNKRITYGARYLFAHAEGNVEGLEPQHDIHLSTTALDLNAFFKPFKSDKHLLLLGLGISVDFTRTSYLSNTDYIISDDKIYTIADTDGIISILEPVFNFHYYYSFSKNLQLGININARDINFYQYIMGVGACVKL